MWVSHRRCGNCAAWVAGLCQAVASDWSGQARSAASSCGVYTEDGRFGWLEDDCLPVVRRGVVVLLLNGPEAGVRDLVRDLAYSSGWLWDYDRGWLSDWVLGVPEAWGSRARDFLWGHYPRIVRDYGCDVL